MSLRGGAHTEVPERGVHRLRARRSSRQLCRDLTRDGWRCFLADLHEVTDRADLLRVVAAAIGARASAGTNWDAFEEAVRDLAWDRAERYALVITGGRRLAAADPSAWTTLLDVLRGACRTWEEHGVPMVVLVRGVRVGR